MPIKEQTVSRLQQRLPQQREGLYRMKLIRLLLCMAAWSVTMLANAQEGYPLDGTWRGEWGPAGGAQTLAVVVMNWDGKAINGRINPGRNTINITSAMLDAAAWHVHIDAQGRDGKAIVIEADLQDLGSYHRKLAGTWQQDGVSYPLMLTRE
jgi:hypothetical protein